MPNSIANRITWYKIPLIPYRLPSYKTPTNAKWNLQIAFLDSNATNATSLYMEKNACQDHCVNYSGAFANCSAHRTIWRFLQDMSNPITQRIFYLFFSLSLKRPYKTTQGAPPNEASSAPRTGRLRTTKTASSAPANTAMEFFIFFLHDTLRWELQDDNFIVTLIHLRSSKLNFICDQCKYELR